MDKKLKKSIQDHLNTLLRYQEELFKFYETKMY